MNRIPRRVIRTTERRIRHLVVFSKEQGRMLGILTAGDVLRELAHLKWL